MGNVPIGVANDKPKMYAMQLYLTDLIIVFAKSRGIHSWRFDKVVYALPGEDGRSEEEMNQNH
jgi:hypothetical protein